MAYPIGAAIPFGLFETPIPPKAEVVREAFGSVDAVLTAYANTVDYAELRTVRSHSDPTRVAQAVKALRDRGLTVTIHGTLDEADAFFAPYRELFPLRLQPRYNVTVHPVASFEQTVRLLQSICEQIEEKGYPFFITLENQRITENKPFGSCEEIAAVVEQVNSKHLGICFDFGHQLSNTQKGVEDVVTDRFLSRVRHTHIHSFYEGRTHFPLDRGEANLDANLTALTALRFDGILSLELSAERFAEQFSVTESFANSVSVLRTAAVVAESKRAATAFYREEYASALRTMKERFEQAECAVGLVGPSAYVLKFGDTRIAVDVAPNVLAFGEAEQTCLADWIGEFDAYLLTHAHRDHYDPEFLAKLPPDMVNLVPDFMEWRTPSTVCTTPGFSTKIQDVAITVFESGHAHAQGGVPEYGFCIEYRGESFVFPCDVRNFEFPFPRFSNVRAVFTHLWLGKANALNLHDNPYVNAFCEFADRFDATVCCIAHLNDTHRRIQDMWTSVHAQAVCDKLTNAKPFTVGELLEFS